MNPGLYYVMSGMTPRQAKRHVAIITAAVRENETNKSVRRCTVRILKVKPAALRKTANA